MMLFGGNHLRVLVIDDDAISRRTACLYLRQLGAETAECSSGRGGVGLARRAMEEARPYDVVLIDLFLEDQDGDQVAVELSQLPRRSVLMLCSSAFETDGDEAPGFNEVLAKPLSMVHLQMALRRHFPDRFLSESNSPGWGELKAEAGQPRALAIPAAEADAEVCGRHAEMHSGTRWKPHPRHLDPP
jgi:CheY-like chemotaxis protein